ncbi:YlaH-like family protein [Microaerobacter geothermalis]|uniref:YlaH-like family protein n=1 Tax=Microaerobacter geothermalis TaxID=674972 RepID=UPI001F3DF071|nr:YlaH-like family protein [Microaerobacter geothermalis]MCF6093550.1 YlaH-like family protein [Microaerobacter geothermalis]
MAMLENINQLIEENAYLVVFVLTALVYKLGFARPLPLLKSLIIYFLLAIGVIPLTLLYAFGLPIVPALAVALVLLIVVRVRRNKSESYGQENQHSDQNRANEVNR